MTVKLQFLKESVTYILEKLYDILKEDGTDQIEHNGELQLDPSENDIEFTEQEVNMHVNVKKHMSRKNVKKHIALGYDKLSTTIVQKYQ